MTRSRQTPPRIASLLLSMLAAASVGADELSEAEARGKRIYHGGESESGAPITAVVARGSTPIAAEVLPCAGCHGRDGRGRPEGGVIPPDIRWRSLTAPLGHEHPYGRSHPGFDASSLARAIRAGVDPAGNTLDTAMPRYAMSEADMADLIAYIERIESDLDAGLSGTQIRLGTLLPLDGPLAGLGRAMEAVMRAYFADVNAGGGVHGRSIELVVGGYDSDRTRRAWQTRDLLEQQSVFALVSGYVAGIEDEVAALVEERQVPWVGPFTVLPKRGDGLARHSFYLLGGLEQQARALTGYLASSPSIPVSRLAVVHPGGAHYDAVVEAVRDEASAMAGVPVLGTTYAAGGFDAADTARGLHRQHADAVVFCGRAADLKALAEEAERIGWTPRLLLPGVFAARSMLEIPGAFEGRVLVAYSSLPADHSAKGVSAFQRLHETHGIDYSHSAAQIHSYVAATIIVEGLKRAGRNLSREQLVRELEGLADFQPGLMPAISYGPTRRIGALGAYVVSLDLAGRGLSSGSPWIDLGR